LNLYENTNEIIPSKSRARNNQTALINLSINATLIPVKENPINKPLRTALQLLTRKRPRKILRLLRIPSISDRIPQLYVESSVK